MQNLSDCIAVSRKILMLHSTLLHTLQIFAIFVYFALVPSHALGASTSRAATLLFHFLKHNKVAALLVDAHKA